jgi:hypothetical protein
MKPRTPVLFALAAIGCGAQSSPPPATADVVREPSPVAVTSAPVSPSASVLDPRAISLLRRSTEYVAGLHQFELEASTALEAVTRAGQKLQFEHEVRATFQRPNKMRVERSGELIDQTFYYDGKTLAIDMPVEGYYATAAMPPTLDAALDTARDKLGVIAPGADFIYTDAFERLSDKLTSAVVLGEAYIDDVRCDHLAFRNPAVDWQLYVEQGATPFPRKVIITSKMLPQSPDSTITISKWNVRPQIKEAMFTFTPPAGAQKIDFLPLAAARKNRMLP